MCYLPSEAIKAMIISSIIWAVLVVLIDLFVDSFRGEK